MLADYKGSLADLDRQVACPHTPCQLMLTVVHLHALHSQHASIAHNQHMATNKYAQGSEQLQASERYVSMAQGT